MKRIGLYPGTFDPVHKGHLAFAEETAKICNLDTVIFLPERHPRGKQNVTDLQHRVALLEQAIATHPNASVAILKSDRFTVKDTLPELRALCGNASVTLLAGSDVMRNLWQWPDLTTLFEHVSLAIGMRAGDTQGDIDEATVKAQRACKVPINLKYIYAPHAEIASSQVRESGAHALTSN
ncbi:MAG TPA: nicotinate-nicotinamide nucleotide adenylyltransferase [Candidatus Saccharimonas sp.]|nr:nicotinate-nicotinamide nucleotide adenylyltransferase [Candidatus Saccharimonas sp.]